MGPSAETVAGEPGSRAWLRRLGGAAVACAAALLAYRRSFTVPFQFDDIPNIVDNRLVHATRLGWSSLAPALSSPFRQLAYLSFAVSHALGGLEPWGWHLWNLAFHLASGLLVWGLSARLLALLAPAEDPSARRSASFLAALLFLLHPVQTQAVTYVVQRMASMGAFFALLSAWLYLEARARRRWPLLAAAAASLAGALLCKESFAALPGVLLLADPLLFPEERRARRLAWVAGAALAAALLLLAWTRYGGHVASEARRFGLGPLERLLTQPRVLWHYLSLLALPLPGRLRVDYQWAPSRSLVDPISTLPALLGLVALLALAFAGRRRRPLAAFAALWFFGNLAVEQSVLPLDLVYEHRLYLPSVGPLLLVASLAARALRTPVRRWLAAAPVLALLAAATDARNGRWNDPLALHGDVVADSPGAIRALLTVGVAHYDRGELAEAEAAFRQALAREPGNPRALNDLGNVAVRRGRRAEAEALYRRAVAAAPGEVYHRRNLARLLLEAGRNAEGENALREILALDPLDAPALSDLGKARWIAGDRAGALAAWEAAVRADPSSPEARRARADALAGSGRHDLALADLRALVSLRPGDAAALLDLGTCLERLERGQEALEVLERAARRDPRLPGLRFAAGNARASLGDLAGAEREYLAELERGPHSGALNNLGNVWRDRDPARALQYYRRALEADPGNAAAAENLRSLGGR